MGLSSATNVIDPVATHLSPAISTSNGRGGLTPVVEVDAGLDEKKGAEAQVRQVAESPPPEPRMQRYRRFCRELFTWKTVLQCGTVLVKFGKFTGPGTIISVAYIDPDNYQTAVSSGTEFKFKLLFMVLVSNLIAIYLQVSTV